MVRPIVIALLLACAGCGSGPGAPMVPSDRARVATATVPVVGGCKVFPADNPWNADISKYPLDPNSANYIKSIPGNLHPDFGNTKGYGIPFNVVPAGQPLVPVKFGYASQSDPGPYPVPPNAYIEGWPAPSGDRHVLVLQQGSCTLYEMWNARTNDGGKSWTAGSGAIFHLNSNALRPDGWTSADAAGLPIMPALVKCKEVQTGVIDHARVRLKASFDIAHFNRVSQIILTAMKKYGMFVADGGSGSWYFQGQGGPQESCWSNNQLDQLKTVPGSAFEVVKTGPILRVSGP